MANKPNRTCIICNTAYYYCPSCRNDATKPAWYAIFDGENCNEIYTIVTNYRDKNIDAKVAQEKLSKCDISGLKDFEEGTKKIIEEILGTKGAVNKVDEKVEVKIETKSVETKAKPFMKSAPKTNK